MGRCRKKCRCIIGKKNETLNSCRIYYITHFNHFTMHRYISWVDSSRTDADVETVLINFRKTILSKEK